MSTKLVIEGPDGKSYTLDEETSKDLIEQAKEAHMSPEEYLKKLIRDEFYRVNN